jgi:formate-dependent nitrite reductase membrane component NrfD
MNPKVNGQMQTEWSWLIAVYLFLGGVGAGAYTIAAINGLLQEQVGPSTMMGLWIAFPALLIGSGFLLADLGTPQKAILAGKRPGSSWIARGTWIITLFMVVSFLHLVLVRYLGMGREDALVPVLSILGIALAIGTMAYTGILLGASKGIPFWRSGAVPVVFVISALVTGHFAIMIGMMLVGGGVVRPEEYRLMAAEAAGLVVLELLAIFFYLSAAYKLPDPRESVRRILKNRMFVVGYFVLGLGAPLAIALIVLFATPAEAAPSLPLLALGAILGLVGGLILRQAVLVSGALPTLNIAGFEFRRIARPKEPKPGIGLLPPR